MSTVNSTSSSNVSSLLSNTSLGSASITGLASGIDTTALVNAMTQQDEGTLNQLQSQQTTLQNKISAWNSLESLFTQLQTDATSLANQNNILSATTTSSNTNVLTATSSGATQPGSYVLNVIQLATAQSSRSQSFSSASATIGQGTFTITPSASGSTPLTINITSSNNTLQGLADAINGTSGSPVSANIISNTNGTFLTLTSNQTGVANGFTVTDNVTDGGTAVSFSGASSSTDYTQGTTLTTAQDAQVQLGTTNPLTIDSSSNTVTSLVPGLSVNLVGTGQSTLNVNYSDSNAKTLINNFVTDYNNIIAFQSQYASYNTTTQTAGVLFGDPSFNNFMNQLTGAVSSAATGNISQGNPASIADLGITISTDPSTMGQLSFNSSTFDSAFSSNPQAVANSMMGLGTTNNPNATVIGYASQTKGGTYTVNVTGWDSNGNALATINGQSVTGQGNVINGLTGTAADGLGINVNSGFTGSFQVTMNKGIFQNVLDALTPITQPYGQVSSVITNLTNNNTALQSQITQQTSFVQQRRNLYLQQFAQMESTLASLDLQNMWLGYQTSAMSGSSSLSGSLSSAGGLSSATGSSGTSSSSG
ncbi:MAG: flagellar filament capping protein FliD [Thermodesulfobium sp.]